MARQLRIEYPDAHYHVMNRGFHKGNIFIMPQMKNKFLKYLEEYLIKFNVKCYASCIMHNHYHLFICTPEGNLTTFMKNLNNAYANWFSKKIQQPGQVFSGRYKAILVDSEKYSFSLARYIHLNPVRGNLVKDAEEYKFSNLHSFLFNKRFSFDIEDIILKYGQNIIQSTENYIGSLKQFDEKKFKREVYKKIAIGDEDFKEKVNGFIEQYEPTIDIPCTLMNKTRSYKVIIKKISKFYNVDENVLFYSNCHNDIKSITIYLISIYTRLKVKEIAEKFNIPPSSISYHKRKIKNKLKHDKKLVGNINNITKML